MSSGESTNLNYAHTRKTTDHHEYKHVVVCSRQIRRSQLDKRQRSFTPFASYTNAQASDNSNVNPLTHGHTQKRHCNLEQFKTSLCNY